MQDIAVETEKGGDLEKTSEIIWSLFFIGNVNPVVDSAELWGIFKPFGKVRDVYLSEKKNPRNSCFAFIQFESLEEAETVARRVNGIHVYG
ncbi:hypothetical protein LWI28_029263 [Acer negundo]|uniref:RRM domain-containing protein n=1 Tax=Acer negundo TaxID=4023 RepID=A0AAD5J215_ACENE|nr:hypothetical protein LWI28_029263 [Acer negundo]